MESLSPIPGRARTSTTAPWSDRVPAWSTSSPPPPGWNKSDLDLHPFRIADGDLPDASQSDLPTCPEPPGAPNGSTNGLAGRGRSGRPSRYLRSPTSTGPPAMSVWIETASSPSTTGTASSVASEAVAAGQAFTTTWRSTGETLDGPTPDAGEIERFLVSFATPRGALLGARAGLPAPPQCGSWPTRRVASTHSNNARPGARYARTWLRSQAQLLWRDQWAESTTSNSWSRWSRPRGQSSSAPWPRWPSPRSVNAPSQGRQHRRCASRRPRPEPAR